MRNIINLGTDTILSQQVWGGYIAVPSTNIDVAIGIVREGIHEPWTTRLVQELLREGQTYLNVGANFGYYTALGGHIVGPSGKVHSIEANPYVMPYTMKTIYWSSVSDRVELYNVAIGDVEGGTVNFAFDYQYMGGGGVDRGSKIVARDGSPYWDVTNIDFLVDRNRRWVKGRGLYNTFQAHFRTLDALLSDVPAADLLHMDIEGSEPAAIAGGHELIRRSPNLRIITEWGGQHYQNGSPEQRKLVEDMWAFLVDDQKFRVRHIEPQISADGGLYIGKLLNFDEFVQMPHGDYVWVRASQDPWG